MLNKATHLGNLKAFYYFSFFRQDVCVSGYKRQSVCIYEAKAFCDGLADQMNRSNRWYKLVCASQDAENQLGLS